MKSKIKYFLATLALILSLISIFRSARISRHIDDLDKGLNEAWRLDSGGIETYLESVILDTNVTERPTGVNLIIWREKVAEEES